MEQIECMGNSAAAVLCHLSREVPLQKLHSHFMGDMIGLVALLGRVHSTELSRCNACVFPLSQLKQFICHSFFLNKIILTFFFF